MNSFVCSEIVEKSVAFSGQWNVKYTLLYHSEDAGSPEGRCVQGGRWQRSREAEACAWGRVCWCQGGADRPSLPPLPSTPAALVSTSFYSFPWVLKLTPVTSTVWGRQVAIASSFVMTFFCLSFLSSGLPWWRLFSPGTENEHVFTTCSKLALGSHLSNLEGIYY